MYGGAQYNDLWGRSEKGLIKADAKGMLEIYCGGKTLPDVGLVGHGSDYGEDAAVEE